MAATYLTKLVNLPVVLIALLAIVAKLLSALPRNPLRVLGAFAAFFVCAAIPIGSWMFWSKIHFGDVTGSTTKIALLGWTQKAFADWWHHPIFTMRSLSMLWSVLIAIVSRGEQIWQNKSLILLAE